MATGARCRTHQDESGGGDSAAGGATTAAERGGCVLDGTQRNEDEAGGDTLGF